MAVPMYVQKALVLETPAEIKMFHMLGGDTVGVTNVPEVNLANEAQMAYATISMITNYAAGISESALTHGEVVEMMGDMAAQLKALILGAIDVIDVDADMTRIIACKNMVALNYNLFIMKRNSSSKEKV